MKVSSMVFILVAALSLAATENSKTWTDKNGRGFKVKFDPVHHGVDVFLDKDAQTLPQSIGMTFYQPNGQATSIRLRAIEPSRFSGTYGPTAQSFVGFEIQIPVGSEKSTLVKSEELDQE